MVTIIDVIKSPNINFMVIVSIIEETIAQTLHVAMPFILKYLE